MIRFPLLASIPELFRGRRLLSLRFAYPGPIQEGARLAAPLRVAAPVYLDALGELPATEVARIHNDPGGPGSLWIAGVLLTHVDQEFASTLLDHVVRKETPFVSVEIRHLGQATRRDVPGGSAVGGRGSNVTLGLAGVPTLSSSPRFFPPRRIG